MVKQIWIILLLAVLPFSGFSQANKLIKKGNELYAQGKYAEAAQQYQQALKAAPGNAIGSYNEANALLQQGKLAAARKALEDAIKNFDRKDARANAYYNAGNSYMQEQKWQDAINAYKQALRQNPGDADAKYNLSYALEKLKKQQEEQQKNQDKNKDQKDKKDEQKDKDKQDQQDKQDQGQQQQQQQKEGAKEQQKKPQPQPGKLSKEQAENIMNALQQEERKVQGRVRGQKGIPASLEKDW